MKLKKAIKILEDHQKWRLGDEEIIQTNGRELTESINTVLKEVKNRKNLLIKYHESQMPAVRESHSLYIENCIDKFLNSKM